MSVETVFYIVGLTLTALALIVSFAGLKLKGFPSKGASLGIIALFSAFVVATCGLAVAVASKEQEERRAEQAEAAALADESEEPTPSDDAETNPDAEAAEQGGQEGDTTTGDAASGPGGTLQLAADPAELAYDETELTSAPGEVTIEFDNPSPIPHDVAVRQDEGDALFASEVVTETSTSAVGELEPGQYTFFCTVPGHEEAGMVGTLTVE